VLLDSTLQNKTVGAIVSILVTALTVEIVCMPAFAAAPAAIKAAAAMQPSLPAAKVGFTTRTWSDQTVNNATATVKKAVPAAGKPVPKKHTIQSPAGKQAQVAQLIEQLAVAKVEVRLAALKGLAQLGADAGPAVPAIITVLNDNRDCQFGTLSSRISPVITDQVLNTLKAIGPAGKIAAPYLVTMLTDRNELFRLEQILDTLAYTGLDDSAAKTIIYVTRSEGKLTKTRKLAIHLLGIIDPPSGAARDVLNEIIQDRNDKPSREDAMSALKILLDNMAKRDAAVANGEKPEITEQMSELAAALDSDDIHMRLDAAHKVGELGPKAAILVPHMITIITDQSTDKRLGLETMKSIGSVGPEAGAALPALISKLMSEHDELDRGSICRAITAIDPSGKRTMQLIAPALEDPFRARIALELLEEIGTGESTNLAHKVKLRWHMN
jgi:hypothetical protein